MAVGVIGHRTQVLSSHAMLQHCKYNCSSFLKQHRLTVCQEPRSRRSLVVSNVAAPYARRLAPTTEPPVIKRSASEEAKQHEYGTQTRVNLISSPDEFQQVLAENPTKLIVLMCKAKFCRPCKMFSRKFTRLADKHTDSMFLDVVGDENVETRQMMMDMKVKATPHFRIYRGSSLLSVITGANEKKVASAIAAVLLPGESGYAALPELIIEDDSDDDE